MVHGCSSLSVQTAFSFVIGLGKKVWSSEQCGLVMQLIRICIREIGVNHSLTSPLTSPFSITCW